MTAASCKNTETSGSVRAGRPDILLAFHGFGPTIFKDGQEYYCAEGIARVMRQSVRALTDAGYGVVATAYSEHVDSIHGYFAPIVADGGRFRVLDVSGERPRSTRPTTDNEPISQPLRSKSFAARIRTTFALFLTNPARVVRGSKHLHSAVELLRYIVVNSLPEAVLWKLRDFVAAQAAARREKGYESNIEDCPTLGAVLVSHYYLFPEIAELKSTPVVLYLPDYLPHFYQGQRDMGASPVHARIGKLICERADRIITNSRFTQNYLPETELEVAPDKIKYFPLPDLGEYSATAAQDKQTCPGGLLDRYLFYPTRERASKRLWDFAATVAEVNRRLVERGCDHKIFGVLTDEPSARVFATCPQARDYIKVFPNLSDAQLKVFYQNALALLFTSELEGNFPTQVREALNLRTPIIATRNPLITDELGSWTQHLVLVDVGDTDAYAAAVLDVIDNRYAAIDRQEALRIHLRDAFSYERFASELTAIFDELCAQPSTDKLAAS